MKKFIWMAMMISTLARLPGAAALEYDTFDVPAKAGGLPGAGLISNLGIEAIRKETAAPPENRQVTVFGSSTIWGSGLLGELSIVGEIDRFLREEWSTAVYPDAMRFVDAAGKRLEPVRRRNRKFFTGEVSELRGEGAFVEFELDGDELAVCQAIFRTPDYARIGVYADGQRIGGFGNRNPTLGESAAAFTGDGKTRAFPLGRPFTYDHRLTLDGRELKVKLYDLAWVAGEVAKRFPGYDALVVRIAPQGKVEHFLFFFTPPAAGAKIDCAFRYGETIAYTDCTVGGQEREEELESCYGIGNVSFDPANPTSFSAGLDFRAGNPRAFFRHRFDVAARRTIRLVLEGGVNPYLAIDFAANRLHTIQNAGIGGFTAKRFLTDPYGRRLTDSLKRSVPDLAFIVLGGNDDWAERERLVSREVDGLSRAEVDALPSMQYASIAARGDGRFRAVKKSGLISGITPTTLTSPQLRGAKVEPGCFLRIGDYCGDNNSTAVRVVTAFDPEAGSVAWREPLDPARIVGIEKVADLVGAEFTVRTLAEYSGNIEKMVKILREANPAVKIVLLNTYVPNYFMREVWGYAEALEAIAARHPGCVAADATPALNRWIANEITGNTAHEFTSTGATEYELPWPGHCQGFEVLVDGKPRYGRGCQVASGWYYAPVERPDGSFQVGRTSKLARVPMRLLFTADPPPPGAAIRVIRADRLWSGDFAHPTAAGCQVIGQVAIEAIRKLY